MRVSPDGTRYVYTDRTAGPTITLVTPGTDVRALGAGQDARWRGSAQIWWRPQDDTPLCFAQWPSWALEHSRLASGNSLAVGGGQTAVHRTDPLRIIEDGHELVRGFSWPVYSDDAALLATLQPDFPHAQMQSIELFGPGAGRRTLYQGSVVDGTQGSDFRLAGTTLCFREASGHVFGVVDIGNATLRPELLARPGEGVSHACPVYLPERGLYVLHVRATGGGTGRVCLGTWESMRAGTPIGWVLGESGGGGYEHDARLVQGTATTALIAWMRPDGGSAFRVLDVLDRGVVMLASAPAPFGVAALLAKALGYFFDAGPMGAYAPKRNCTITGAGLWKKDYDGDGDQELPPDIDAKLAAALDAVPVAFLGADPIDLARPLVKARWAKILGVFIHEPGTLAAAHEAVFDARREVGAAGLAPRPVITILTADKSTDRTFAGVGDALAPEIYFTPADFPDPAYSAMLTVARARIAAVCDALAPSPLYLVVQAYIGALTSTQPALEAIQQAANEALAREQVRGLWWFAYGRRDGVLFLPQLERWHAAQVAVTPAPAPILDTPPTKPPPKPPAGDAMTHDDIHRYMAALTNDILFGAVKRFHDEVLPRDRPLDPLVKSGAWVSGDLDFNTNDVVTGGANGFFVRAYVSEFIIAMDKGRTGPQASGDGYDAAITAYKQATNPQ